MITAIREARRARGMTLDDVARACVPPTTSQQIGRLETGTRRASLEWLNRIAAALGVSASDLVRLPERSDVPVAALLGTNGTMAPRHPRTILPPSPEPGLLAVQVELTAGDYRTGDTIWCRRLAPEAFGQALNRDVLVPRPAGRFVFGRLIGMAGAGQSTGGGAARANGGDGARLQILPPLPRSRQQVVAEPPWLAVAVRLLRDL